MNLSSDEALIPFSLINPANGLTINGTARIDTGADISVISPNLASAIQAVSTGTITIIGVTGGATDESEYTLDIDLGTSGYIGNVNLITDSNLSSIGVDMLIGVDVLGTGIFDYDGQTGSFDLNVGLPQVAVSTASDWLVLAGVGLAIAGLIGGIMAATWETKQVESAFRQGIIAAEGARWAS